MSVLSLYELPRPERQEAAIREAVRLCGKRLRTGPLEREHAAWRAVESFRSGVSAAKAVSDATRALRCQYGEGS